MGSEEKKNEKSDAMCCLFRAANRAPSLLSAEPARKTQEKKERRTRLRWPTSIAASWHHRKRKRNVSRPKSPDAHTQMLPQKRPTCVLKL
ncbi:hypothetical protein QQF64_034413 [Cirrhinus molitorella]|uniref:Uncharacterized protein n=1 Tax=Cirrhinus molitorella TaxID=172907 RepID=A0ABR3L5V1_9TELE